MIVAIVIDLSTRKRRTGKLRDPLGTAIDVRARERNPEPAADGSAARRTSGERPNEWRPCTSSRSLAGDRARFVESWGRVQARFIDGPGSAVTDADQLLGDVLSTRGYSLSDFERARRISPWIIHASSKITVQPTKPRFAARRRGNPARKTCARP